MEQKIVDGIVNVFRGKASINNQSVVLCCPNCTPNERDRIIEDILSPDYGCDCVVRYAENTTELGKAEIERLVKNSALLVFYVNQKTIDDRKNGILFYEYDFADKNNTPIIPIVHADRKRDFSAAFDKDGEKTHGIQYFEDGSEGRLTEYKEKLKKEFDKYITEQGTVKNIKSNAFKAKIFLSYRQKDNSVKKGTHIVDDFLEKFYAVPEFEAVSVWYDKYLDAGEDYADEIREAIDDCDVFALIVTENMLAEGNYVIKHEYPYALKKQWDIQNITENLGEKGYYKPIVAVFAETVDEDRLFERFTGIDKFPSGSFDSEESRTALFGYFKEILGKKLNTESTSEQLYYLGEAYLNGVGVVRDVKKGISVLERAGKSFDDEYGILAARLLPEIYSQSISPYCDFNKAIEWLNRIYDVLYENYRTDLLNMKGKDEAKTENKTDLHLSTHIREHPDKKIGEVYFYMGEQQKAIDCYKKCIKDTEEIFGGEDYFNICLKYPVLAKIYGRIGWSYFVKGKKSDNSKEDYEEALKLLTSAEIIYTQYCNDEELSNYNKSDFYIKTNTDEIYIEDLQNSFWLELSMTQQVLSRVLCALQNSDAAIRYAIASLDIIKKLVGTDNLLLARAYDQVAGVYFVNAKYDLAFEYYKKALPLYEKHLGRDHIAAELTYRNLGFAYSIVEKSENEIAEDYINRWLRIQATHYGVEKALNSYKQLGVLYLKNDALEKAKKIFDEALFSYEKQFGEVDKRTLDAYTYVITSYEEHEKYGCASEICSELARLLEKNNRTVEAISFYFMGMVNDKRALGEDNPDLPRKLVLYIKRFLESEDFQTADFVMSDACVIIHDLVNSCTFTDLDSLDDLAALAVVFKRNLFLDRIGNNYALYALKLSDQQRYEEAIICFNKALPLCKRANGDEHLHTVNIIYGLGKMHFFYANHGLASGELTNIDAAKSYALSLKFLKEALDIMEGLPSDGDSLIDELRSDISNIENTMKNI
jgi:tetratricopeptide (TPR) repeat protein